MDIETIRLYMEIGGYAAGVASVLFLAIQLRKERKLEEYRTLRELEEKYTELLWRGSEEEELNKVWEPMPDNRKNVLDGLINVISSESWVIWTAMNESEKNCYRFTRSGFEVLEQAYIATKKGWVDDVEIQNKWKYWTLSWKDTNSFAPYVLAEMERWYTPSFISYYRSLK